jgi:excisionase family DNA binding protein
MNKQAQQTEINLSAAHQPPKILTVAQVAELLQIPKSSIYEKTRSRRGAVPPLPCRRVGKYLRFVESEVLDWLLRLPKRGTERVAASIMPMKTEHRKVAA